MHVRMRRESGSAGKLIAGILGCLFSASLVLAQLPTATILGVVKDASGAVVPGATLTARNSSTGQTRTAVSAEDGSYRFPALPVGTYEIRVGHTGFQSALRQDIPLAVAQEAVVNFTLQVGAVEQTVSVTGELPLVNTTSGSLGGLVSEERVSDLPLNGRNFVDLTLLQPGIALDRSASTTDPNVFGAFFSSNGAPLRSNTYLLDGAIMQNLIGATSASASGSTLGIEGIREWRVITNSFSAEYGMTMGSQTAIVTKSGTNSFHGSAFEFLRNSALDARNFFDLKIPTIPASSQRRLPALTRNNFGGSLGGPIQKDKLFSFLTYEGLRERLGRTLLSFTIPAGCRGPANATITNTACPQLGPGPSVNISPVTAPLLTLYPEPNLAGNQVTFPYSQPTTTDYGQGRLDYTISPNDSFFGRFTNDSTEQIVPRDFPGFIVPAQSQNQYLTVSENHVFSPTLLNAFRFSFSRTEQLFVSPSPSGPQISFIPGLGVGSITIGGVTPLGPFDPAPINQRQNIFTWSDDLFYTRRAHSLKFGTLINRYQMFLLNNAFRRGRIGFPDLRSFLLAQPNVFLALTPGSISDRTYHYTTLGFYIQDDWRLKSNLTLNLGLRYEFHTVPDEVTGRNVALRDLRQDAATTPGPIFENPSLRNFSPRVGFAWDVRGDGKTAVRGGFGLLYDIATLGSSLIIGTVAQPPFSGRSTVAGPLASSLFRIPLFFPPAGPSLRMVDYHLQQPHLMQYNLTVERQLPLDMALTLAYGGSRGMNLILATEGNPTVAQTSSDGRKFFPVNPPRINPNFGTIELRTASGSSWYNSLQFGLVKRFSKGLQFQSSYTWSKTIDENQIGLVTESTTNSDFLSDPSNLKLDKAPALFDTTQIWRLNGIYRLPGLSPSAGMLEKVLNGWWLSGIVSVQDGLPFTPVLANNRSRSGVNGGASGVDRPDLVPGRKASNIMRGGPDRYFDPSAFTVPEAGFLGTAGRNILRGPGVATVDFTIAKDTPVKYLGEGGKLEFRAEFFNILNRPNFTTPGIGGPLIGTNNGALVFAGTAPPGVVESPLPTVGRIVSTSTPSRQIQFALKLLF